MDSSKDEALREVGRAVVNFQRLELLLKALAKFQSRAGLISQLEQQLKIHNDRASRYTLGQAVGSWLRMLGEELLDKELPDAPSEPVLSIAFSLELEADTKEAHADALSRLLKERNDLIHGELIAMDWNSTEQCQNLIVRLESQNKRIGEQLEFLSTVLRDFLDLARVQKDVIESDDFLQFLAKPAPGEDA